MTKVTCEHSGVEFESKNELDRTSYLLGYTDGFNNNTWISVKTRMPYRQPLGFKLYLVAFKDHEAKVYRTEVRNWHDNSFYNTNYEVIALHETYGEITHWMPLPEPPHKEEKIKVTAEHIDPLASCRHGMGKDEHCDVCERRS